VATVMIRQRPHGCRPPDASPPIIPWRFRARHVRITKRGRVKLQKGWSDKRIARKAKSKVALVRELRADLYNRIHEEVARAPQIGQ
jgi:hypothetical protein